MGADCYTDVSFLRDAVDHAKKVAAVKALDAVGESKLPPGLAKYFNEVSVAEVLADPEGPLTAAKISLSAEDCSETPAGSVSAMAGVALELDPEDDDDYRRDVIIDVAKLPKDVKRIRIRAWVSV